MEGSPHLISWFYGFEGGTKPILDPLKGPPTYYSGKSQIGLDIAGVLGKKHFICLEIESEKNIYVRNNSFQTSHFCWAELLSNPNSTLLSPWSARTHFFWHVQPIYALYQRLRIFYSLHWWASLFSLSQHVGNRDIYF